MVILLRACAALAVFAFALASLACEDAVAPSDISGKSVWSPGERAEYQLREDKRQLGRAVLSVERDGDAFVLHQDFIADQVTDTVAIRVAAADLKPITLRRVVDGKDGRIQLDVEYKDGLAIVHADNGEGRRTESSPIQPFHYDNWEGLFLWRTLPLAEGYTGAYFNMITAVPRKPSGSKKIVSVQKRERLQVPAGDFDAWKIKVTGGGPSETAWINVEAPHQIVRYDSGSVVFDLLNFK